MEKLKIKLLQDRVLVKPLNEDEVRPSGLLLPKAAQEKTSKKGLVLAVGTELDENINPGDIIYYGEYAGSAFTLNNKDYEIMRESDILCLEGEEGPGYWDLLNYMVTGQPSNFLGVNHPGLKKSYELLKAQRDEKG